VDKSDRSPSHLVSSVLYTRVHGSPLACHCLVFWLAQFPCIIIRLMPALFHQICILIASLGLVVLLARCTLLYRRSNGRYVHLLESDYLVASNIKGEH